jgi:hypothetical protein
MDRSRLLVVVGIIASIAASTLAAPPACDLSALAPTLARHCQSDPDVPSFLLSPTAQCCEALVTSLPAQQEVALSCLCRAAAEPPLVTASLDASRLFALYRGCGKGKGKIGRDPNFGNWYCEGIASVPRRLCFLCFCCLREFLIAFCLV